MARQTISLGTGPNAKDGLDLRAGGDIINDNFAELYQQHRLLGYAVVRQDAGQAISDVTRTQILVDTTDEDSDSVVSGNTFVVPSSAGWEYVEISVQVSAVVSAAAVDAALEALRNTTTLDPADPTAGAAMTWHDSRNDGECMGSLTYSVACADGDVFRFYWTQSAGVGSTLYMSASIRGYGRLETP